MSRRGAARDHEGASRGGAAMMAMAALVTLVALSLAMVMLVAHSESHRAVPVRATCAPAAPARGDPGRAPDRPHRLTRSTGLRRG